MQLLSKVFAAKRALIQPITARLSIYDNFSLGRLWIAFHKKPGEGVFAKGQVDFDA